MKIKYFLFAITFIFVSCVPVEINQYIKDGKIQKRDGNTGDWKYYNEKGKLIYIKKYSKGKPLDSVSYQN